MEYNFLLLLLVAYLVVAVSSLPPEQFEDHGGSGDVGALPVEQGNRQPQEGPAANGGNNKPLNRRPRETADAPASAADKFYANVKNSLKNRQGLDCLNKAVVNVDDKIADFQDDVDLCTHKPPLDVYMIVEDSGDLRRLASSINKDYDKVCHKDDDDEEEDDDAASQPLSKDCSQKIERKMKQLYDGSIGIVDRIKSLKTKDSCIVIAMANFRLNLGNLPNIMPTCARLANQA